MTKIFVPLIAALLLMNGVCSAADAPASAPLKIGVVDMQAVATDSEPAKAARAQMEDKYGKERNALEKQGNSLKKQAQGLKGNKVSEQKRVDFLKAKQKLDNETHAFMRKVEKDELKLRQDMVTLVFNATYEVARAKGFNFVVDVTAGGVLYADKSMDLTQDVLAEVNRIYAANNGKKPEAQPAAQPASPASK